MKYLDLFTGIGGFTYGIEKALLDNKPETNELQAKRNLRSNNSNELQRTATCIGYSEIDKYASAIYSYHYPDHINYGDITRINAAELPDFDLLVGGFPCQAFSIAGKRRGFDDTRGTLFFDIARILKEKRPRHFILENVKGLLSHDAGRTFKTIIATLAELGYCVEWQVLNSKDFGVPQNRERVFIVGHLQGGDKTKYIFPLELKHDHEIEKVYIMPDGISSKFQELLISRQGKRILREQMQDLLEELQQKISTGEWREIPNEAEIVDSNSQRGVQIIEKLESPWTQSDYQSEGVCGVVSIPTEEMLLLWASRGNDAEDKGQLQQPSVQADGGQSRFIEKLRSGKSCPLLLAVQSHQGRLFYSIGDGENWQNLYIKTLDLWNKTLSSILEESPNEKYFLSPKVQEKILKNLQEEQTKQAESMTPQESAEQLKMEVGLELKRVLSHRPSGRQNTSTVIIKRSSPTPSEVQDEQAE